MMTSAIASVPVPAAEQAGLRAEMARRLCRASFMDFVRAIAPWFTVEEVHLLIARKLEDVAAGIIDRLMVFMPPRAGKSQLLSKFFIAWYLGRYPDRKVLQVSYSAERATGFGREVRDYIRYAEFQDIFPGVELTPDSKAAGRWAVRASKTAKVRGEYYAAGVGSGIAGTGFNLGIIDDPLSEQDIASKVRKDYVWDWYGPGFYTRRQPEHSAIIVITTRWADDDLAGRLLAEAKTNPEADQWEVVEIPAVIDAKAAKRLNAVANDNILSPAPAGGGRVIHFRPGDSFAPRRWPLVQLLRQKANMPGRAWEALYQQKPVRDDGNILKRSAWRRWKNERPPECEFVVQVYDTAFEEKETNDYSARTTWGVFERSDTGDPSDNRWCVILLERWQARVGFPDLRDEAMAAYKEFEPDLVAIEKKASGQSLIQELRLKGVPVKAIDPKSRSKLARVHAASVVLELGSVFYMGRKWADDVIDQCASFPHGEHDDLVDTCAMAWNWLRQHWWLSAKGDYDPKDDEDEDDEAAIQAAAPRRIYG